MPRGSDESWVGKLNEKCVKYKHFEKARFGAACMYSIHFITNTYFRLFMNLISNLFNFS